MLADSHCHLNLDSFQGKIKEIYKRLEQEPMLIINVGTCFSTSKKAVELAKEYPLFFASVGLHPSHTNPSLKDPQEIDSQLEILPPESFDENFLSLLKEEKVVAIGETGLDFKYLKDLDPEKILKQEEEFKKQIKIAQEFNLPLIIHVRDIYEKALEILKELNFDPLKTNFKGVFHFFSGSLEQAKKILNQGFFIGFSGIITYNKKLEEVVKNVPLEKILAETDSPYAAPLPYKGEMNYPFYVKEVISKIAQIKNLDFKEVEEKIFKNTLNFFSISL
ncbi:MAG: TatD family hydrolase [Candidatus Paceibacterota bacterium]